MASGTDGIKLEHLDIDGLDIVIHIYNQNQLIFDAFLSIIIHRKTQNQSKRIHRKACWYWYCLKHLTASGKLQSTPIRNESQRARLKRTATRFRHSFALRTLYSYTQTKTIISSGSSGTGLLLLRHTDGATATTGRLGVLTAHTQTPVMAHTTVGTDLLQALQILTQLRVQIGAGQLGVLAVDDVLLPVQEPGGHLVLTRIQDDGDQLLDLQPG